MREKRYRKPGRGALHVRQVPELGDAMRGWLGAHGRGWDYYDQRIGNEGLVNALLADFLAMTPEAQKVVLARAIPRAEAMERRWNEEMARLEAAGLIEGVEHYKPIGKPETTAKPKRGASSVPVGLEDVKPAGPAVVLDEPNGTRQPTPKRDRPKRRA